MMEGINSLEQLLHLKSKTMKGKILESLGISLSLTIVAFGTIGIIYGLKEGYETLYKKMNMAELITNDFFLKCDYNKDGVIDRGEYLKCQK